MKVDRSDIEREAARLDAISRTMRATGEGEVIAGARPREAGETTAPLSGAQVADKLAARGFDPFALEDDRQFAEELDREIEEALERAARTGRPQTDYIRRVMIGAALDAAERVKEKIERGELKSNSGEYRRFKEGLARAGLISADAARTYGKRSGRFLRSIEGRWHRG